MFGSGKPHSPAPEAPLGTALVALRLQRDAPLPPGCVELVFSAAGQARRAPRQRAGKGEVAYAYHPGPYETVFAPFAAAPEIGLRLRYVADAADPRVAQQRFDLFLFSEAGDALAVDALHGAIAAAVRDALAQGALDLPACTTLDEWHGFRAGLNELLYTRFGLTVDDCVPVDLGDAIDYAALLRARAAPVAEAAAPAAPAACTASGGTQFTSCAAAGQTGGPAPADAAQADAHALRRLFLELPAWCAEVRALAIPSGQPLFSARREVLQRCAQAALEVNTMPALGWAAPGRALGAAAQARRAGHSIAAAQALDQAWGLLARWRLAARHGQQPGAAPSLADAGASRIARADPAPGLLPAAEHAAMLDEAGRVTANLAFHLAARRNAADESGLPAQRMEPHL